MLNVLVLFEMCMLISTEEKNEEKKTKETEKSCLPAVFSIKCVRLLFRIQVKPFLSINRIWYWFFFHLLSMRCQLSFILNLLFFFISTSTLYFIVWYKYFMVSNIWVDSTTSTICFKSNLGIFQLKHIYSKTINKFICVCLIECYRWSRKTVLLLWIKNRTNTVFFIPDKFRFLCRSILLLSFLMVFFYIDRVFFQPFRPLHKHLTTNTPEKANNSNKNTLDVQRNDHFRSFP